MQLGRIHEGLDHFDAAREAYEKVLKITPAFAPALNQLAMLYSSRPETLEMGYALAEKARETNPRGSRTADILGWISYKKGDYRKALPLLQESAAMLPESPEVQYHLGMAQYMLGQEESATRTLQHAVDAGTDFPGKDSARKRLSVLAMDVSNAGKDTRNWLENYLREQPNDPVALMRSADVKQRDGALDQAIKIYERIVAENPLFDPAPRRLALLKQRNDCKQAMESSLNLNLPSPLKGEANAALSECSKEAYQPKPPIECDRALDFSGMTLPGLAADNTGQPAETDCARKPPL
jgi:tetratricopeptide (TPR) repeat protein